MNTIPIVDLGNLPIVDNVAKNPDWKKAAMEIRKGLGTVGFLYIINHNIPKETVEKVFSMSKKFFNLPMEQKMKYEKDTKVSKDQLFDINKYYGYTPISGELLHPTSKAELKEAYDWLDNGVGVYPVDIFPEFYSTIQDFDNECKSFLRKFLKLLAVSLDLSDVDFFLKNCRHFDERDNYQGLYNVRLLHYPSIEDDVEIKPGTVRCGEHSDYGFITLLFQDDIGGLEVKSVDGEWVHAVPVADSILINTGDLTEFWTKGIFPATPHRVVVPNVGDKKRKEERYSVVFFNGPDTNTVVTPMDIEKTEMELQRMFQQGKLYSKEPVTAVDHMMGRIAKQFTSLPQNN